eukprot:6460984-Amphidinium_carterae.1
MTKRLHAVENDHAVEQEVCGLDLGLESFIIIYALNKIAGHRLDDDDDDDDDDDHDDDDDDDDGMGW